MGSPAQWTWLSTFFCKLGTFKMPECGFYDQFPFTQFPFFPYFKNNRNTSIKTIENFFIFSQAKKTDKKG